MRILLIAGLIIIILLTIFVADRLALFEQNLRPQKNNNISYKVEEFVSGLNVPWSISFTSNSRMLVTERPGNLRVIENGVLDPKPIHVFEEVTSSGEEGLMSVTLDPNYDRNKHIYLSLAYQGRGRMFVKVVRFTDQGNRLTDEKTIIDEIPAAQFHAGSRIAFGPDGKLYVTTGDATDRNLAQDKNSLAGKILRANPDGSIPGDNPMPGSLIWSFGHRNPQGIAWHPETKEFYSTEHGPSVFDGPAGGDEVNRILKGENYGWPLVSHERKLEGTVVPILVFTPAEAPASAMFYLGDTLPQFKNNLFFGALRGEGIIRVILDDNNPDKVLSFEKLDKVRFGRIRDVVQGPDGYIYFSTSNRDGRGDPHEKDDRIFRLVPEAVE